MEKYFELENFCLVHEFAFIFINLFKGNKYPVDYFRATQRNRVKQLNYLKQTA